MSSTAFDQQPPPAFISQESYTLRSAHGSVGPVIAVLIVIVILGVVAGVIGRLCSGRSVMGYGQYDLESWAETKCSTCIDGRITAPPPPRGNASGFSTPVSVPAQTHRETKQDELDQSQNPPPTVADS